MFIIANKYRGCRHLVTILLIVIRLAQDSIQQLLGLPISPWPSWTTHTKGRGQLLWPITMSSLLPPLFDAIRASQYIYSLNAFQSTYYIHDSRGHQMFPVYHLASDVEDIRAHLSFLQNRVLNGNARLWERTRCCAVTSERHTSNRNHWP